MKSTINITPLDIENLSLVVRYVVMTTKQMSRCSGRPARSHRRRNRALSQAGLLARCDIGSPFGGSPTPAYGSTKNTTQLLAQFRNDDSFIGRFTPMPPKQYVSHAVAVTDTHITLDQAIAAQQCVSLNCWLNESQKIGKDAVGNAKTTLMDFGIPLKTKGRVTCCPDFVASVSANGQSCLFLGEEDCDTYWANKVIARKAPGYRRVFVSGFHRTHFAGAMQAVPNLFRILLIAPTPSRWDALRRNAVKLLKKDPPEFRALWRFVSKSGPHALTRESFLHGKIFFQCDDDADPQPLIAKSDVPDGHPTGSPVITGQANGQLENSNATAS